MTIHTIKDDNGDATLEGQLLIIRYPAGDCDVAKANPKTEKDRKALLGALYDHYQCSDGMKDGDSINLPNGESFAKCVSYHVIGVDQ